MRAKSIHFTPIVCRIYTDEDIYGDGEIALAYGQARYAWFGILRDFGQLILGKDPLDTEVIWDYFYNNTFWGSNGGPVTFGAMSAIDNALWDIKGKYFGVPVYKLLGSKHTEKLRTYASQLQYGWSPSYEVMKTPEDYANAALKAVEEGFDAVKIDFFTFHRDCRPVIIPQDTQTLRPQYYINMIEERVAAVRSAVGPDVDIIMENHSSTDANYAIQIAKAIIIYPTKLKHKRKAFEEDAAFIRK